VLVAVVLLAGVAEAQPVPDRSERLLGTARLWAKVKFFHPYLAYRNIDFDAALVRAIPKVEAATTVDEYRAALAQMLDVLRDPVTRVGEPAAPPAVTPGPLLATPAPGIVLLDMAAFVAGGFDARAFRQRGADVVAAAANARVLVIDLRTGEPAWVTIAALAYFDGALPAIQQWPAQRVLEHRGWRSQEGGPSAAGYSSTFVTTGAQPAQAPRPTAPRHVVLVAGPHAALPVEALALQASGHATIVASDTLDESAIVQTAEVALPGGLTATVRLGELVWGPPRADVYAKDPRARALELAKWLASDAPPVRFGRVYASPRRNDLPALRVRDDDDHAKERYPSRELRMLAGMRVWATLDTFFPYRYLIADWDAVLRDMLPRLAAAPDRERYIELLREMGARAGDGHVSVAVAAPDPTLKRRGTIGALLRLVQGKVAVARTVDPAAAQVLATGDVIETIDGKPVAQLIADKRPITSGSTPEARDQRVVYTLAFGDENTIAKLGVRDAKGSLREVELPRTVANLRAVFEQPAGAPHWKKLPGRVGYVNMMLLTTQEVPQMLADLADTKAIVLDLRGYAAGSLFALAPRLNVKGARYGAQFLRPHVHGEPNAGDPPLRFFQEIQPVPAGTPVYAGKLVVLIDDRAISHSEHTCLFLAEAAPVTFVGSPTHGANGDITALRLPGGLRMWFTGQEVRWVDGRQLQKIGVQPQITVRPTLAGLRAGRDEVLERALAFLAKGR
jgi:C-terminal processing protease CtpA/Prc